MTLDSGYTFWATTYIYNIVFFQKCGTAAAEQLSKMLAFWPTYALWLAVVLPQVPCLPKPYVYLLSLLSRLFLRCDGDQH